MARIGLLAIFGIHVVMTIRLATLNVAARPVPYVRKKNIEDTVASLRTMVDANSGTQREVTRLLVELTDATRSIKALTDYLERHPEALIRGKGE